MYSISYKGIHYIYFHKLYIAHCLEDNTVQDNKEHFVKKKKKKILPNLRKY